MVLEEACCCCGQGYPDCRLKNLPSPGSILFPGQEGEKIKPLAQDPGRPGRPSPKAGAWPGPGSGPLINQSGLYLRIGSLRH